MYNLLIVGAGYVGTRAAQYFQKKKQRVFAITRSQEKGAELETHGINPVIADLTKPETLKDLPPAHFIVICPAPDTRDEADYRKTYVEGIGNFLNAIKGNPNPYLIVYLSSTGVYGDFEGQWVDEDDLLSPPSERGRILIEAERQVLAYEQPSVVFRLAGIYGPGRNRIQSLITGSAKIPDEDAYMNLIHVDDIVEALPVIFKSAIPGEVYLGCDETPVTRRDFYGWLGQELKVSLEKLPEGKPGGKKCRNGKLRGLDYHFKYPGFKEGYAELIKAELKI